MKIIDLLERIFDHINTIMVVISGILIVGLAFIVGTDITLRYLFHKPLGWVKELSEYILVGLGFLAAAWILKNDAHVRMDLLLTKVSPRVQMFMNITTSILSTIVMVTITWFSIRVTLDLYRNGIVTPTVLEPPKWILMIPVNIGSFLITIQFVKRICTLVKKGKLQA